MGPRRPEFLKHAVSNGSLSSNQIGFIVLAASLCSYQLRPAAALVAASTLLSAQAQGVTDFDAGQVSLRLKDPGDSMVRGALYMLTPWMEPDTCFLGVRA